VVLVPVNNAIANDPAVGRVRAAAGAVALRSTPTRNLQRNETDSMDSIIADGLWALLYGVTAGRLGRRNGPKSAERRLKVFRDGGWVMIPLILIDTRVKALKHGAASVDVTRRSSFGVRVAGYGPNAVTLGWWKESQLGAFDEFIRRAQLQVTTLDNGLEEITTHDVKGSLAHLRAQPSDFVILREVCSQSPTPSSDSPRLQ
jgi:hypothetical protein